MYLDYSKIRSGQMKQPALRLQTLAGEELGVIPWASNVAFEINYSSLSKIEFDVPFQSNGMLNPLFGMLTGYKVLYTEQYGIYLLTRPSTTSDGISNTKHMTGYSIEWLFEKKRLFLQEGTYNFWNPVKPEDTILGRIIELDRTWSVGYVDPRLIGCYRTFDEYDSDPLSFCYGTAMEKYCCAIVFDVYKKTINAYDAGKSRGNIPIYLSYKNLVDTVGVEELTDELATKLHLYGSDGMSIREVNPTGTDYLVDLSWFISNGDLNVKVGDSAITLAEKVKGWDAAIRNRQEYYTSLVAARSSRSAQKLSEEVALTELKTELETLTVQQSVTIQAIALEKTAAGKAKQQEKLDEINRKIEQKKSEIKTQEDRIASINTEMEQYLSKIKEINQELAITSYFTPEEQKILNRHLVEGDVTEETFVATDVDASSSGASSVVAGEILVTKSNISEAELNGKKLYMVSGGSMEIVNAKLKADIVQATLERDPATETYILTAYLGNTTYGERSFPSGMITVSGKLSLFSSDISKEITDGVTTYKGSRVSFETAESKSFFTVNVSEYQKYSVAKELYAFGEEVLSEQAWPIYEFTIESANFLFQKEFAPFKNQLELGKSVYLNMGEGNVLNPKLIGLSFNFESPEDFTMTFSNRYQLQNGVESWVKEVDKASSTSRSFDASKYLYNRVADKTTQVSEFMKNDLNAAVNTIVGAKNKTVLINGAGIQVGGDSKYQLRIVDNMIAMTDDGWKTAKLALGLFASEETGVHWGVNTELLAGKLIIGNNLILENVTDDGVLQFKVDATGAWLNNATMVLQKDSGGRMILDPKYGLLAGSNMLFDTNGTTVTPSFIDRNGEIVLDSDGMPKNTNFFLDIRNGNAYFRGTVNAKSGSIGGWELAEDFLHSGGGSSYVALNASKSTNSLYAIWAGATTPENARFWVKRDGSIYAKDGTFKGVLEAARVSGALKASDGNSWIEGCGIRVGRNSVASQGYNFYVDTAGNVNIQGNLVLKNGSISWGSLNPAITNSINNAQDTANEAINAANDAASDAYYAEKLAKRIANGEFKNGTFINGTEIYSPTIYSNHFNVIPKSTAPSGETSGGFSIYGYLGNRLDEVLRIVYEKSVWGENLVKFTTGAGIPSALWSFMNSYFEGDISFTRAYSVDFTGTRVKGLSAQFG